MYTTMLLVALAGLPGANDGSPAWQTDYYQAKRQGAEEKKPLAVFIGTGLEGWNKLARDGRLKRDVDQVLAQKYIPVYIDTATPVGKRLAVAMGIETPIGIVISDSKGDLMAFYHEGDLADSDLSRYLARYSDPNRTVEWTESNPGKHASYGCADGSCYGGVCTTGTCGYSVGCSTGTCGYSVGCSSGSCGYSGGCGYSSCGYGSCGYSSCGRGGCRGGRCR
jgi:hypothetical protein